MILVLALGAPDGTRSGKGLASGAAMLSARGPLQQLEEHPEWRQFIIQAALRRADELAHLRDLPDEPVKEAAPAPIEEKVAVLPVERGDTEPEDVTGSVNAAPAAILPLEIGETSSMELPNITHEETPPVVKQPGRVKSKVEVKKKTARRFRRAKPPAKPPEPANFFEAIFGVPTTRQASTVTQPVNQPAIRTETQTR
jgi:hypothetical protein